MSTQPKTVDTKKLSYFSKMSSAWWDKSSQVKPLHSLNELRVALVRDGLIETGAVKKELIDSPTPLKGLKILDAGCGGGILSEALAKLGPTIVGIDVCPDLIDQAKAHASLDQSLTNLEYFLESAEDHSIDNREKYDVVVASEVLEHVLEPKLLLEHCIKCLKPGGSIFVTTINKTWTAFFLAIVFAEYIWGINARGTHEYSKFIAPDETSQILKSYNCSTKAVNGMLYNFLGDKWHWSSFTYINYALHAIKE